MQGNYDFSDLGEDDLDAGAALAPGYYRATVAEVRENQFTPGNFDVEFAVTVGPHKGGKVWDTIVSPENAKDVEAGKKCLNRVAMYATRTGLMSKEELAGRQAEIDWSELVGREVVIKVKEHNYTGGDGAAKSKVQVEFSGVFALDDERVPEAERKKLGLATTPAKKPDATEKEKPADVKPAARPAHPKSGAKKKPDYSGL